MKIYFYFTVCGSYSSDGLVYFGVVVNEKNEFICCVIASHSQMLNKVPLFTSVALVVVCSVSLFMTFLKQLICCIMFEVHNKQNKLGITK